MISDSDRVRDQVMHKTKLECKIVYQEQEVRQDIPKSSRIA